MAPCHGIAKLSLRDAQPLDMMPKLSITSAAPETQTWCAIPVYNNAATIVDVVKRARRNFSMCSLSMMAAPTRICGHC